MTETVLVFLLAAAAVGCFVTHGFGWSRGLAFGLACTVAAVVLVPAVTSLPS